MKIKLLSLLKIILEVKFLDFNNNNQIDKKFKSYKKDLNNQFKNKISELKDLTLNQEKFNSLISELISNLSLMKILMKKKKEMKMIKKKINNLSQKIKTRKQKKKKKARGDVY